MVVPQIEHAVVSVDMGKRGRRKKEILCPNIN